MAIKKIRLPDGTSAVIDEWLHWSLYSTIEWAAASGLNLRAFSYVRGQRVPATGIAARTADERDTNMVARTRLNHDEAFVAYAITYEPFALSTASGGSPAVNLALAPAITATDLKRLQRDIVVELFVGAGITKPMFRAPFAWINQSVGSPAWSTGDDLDPQQAGITGMSYGTGGRIGSKNQKRWQLPVYIESDRVMYMKIHNPGGAIAGLRQNIRLRMWIDGLKRRPVA